MTQKNGPTKVSSRAPKMVWRRKVVLAESKVEMRRVMML